MEEFLLYHRRMFIIVLVVSGIAALSLFILLPGELSYGFGFLVGSAAQLIKFGFLDVSTIRTIAANPKDAPKAQLRAMVFTMIIFAVGIVIALRFRMNIWAMAAGVFLPRIVLLVDTFLRPDPFSGKGKKGKNPDNGDSGRQDA